MGSDLNHRRDRGGILLGVILLLVTLTVVRVGVGALVLRSRDARRARETRDLLGVAFQNTCLVNSWSPQASLQRDFSYQPAVPTVPLDPAHRTPAWDLAGLVVRERVGVSSQGQVVPEAFHGANAGRAWNGPYWAGPVDGAFRPLDAWGRPLQLRHVTLPVPGWLVYSLGANGADDTAPGSGSPGGDDLVHPSTPHAWSTPEVGTWRVNGAATGTAAEGFLLTDAVAERRGSVFWTLPKDARTLTLDFDLSLWGAGGDGLALVFADGAGGMTPGFLDQPYLGTWSGAWCGAHGLSPGSYLLAFDTAGHPYDPATPFLGLAVGGTGPQPGGPLPRTWLRTAAAPTLRVEAGIHVRVVTDLEPGTGRQRIHVFLDHGPAPMLMHVLPSGFLPAKAYIGFTAATGAAPDRQRVARISGL